MLHHGIVPDATLVHGFAQVLVLVGIMVLTTLELPKLHLSVLVEILCKLRSLELRNSLFLYARFEVIPI